MSSAPVRFPLAPEEITPELLTRALQTNHPEVRVASIAVLQSSIYGNGSTSTADRIALALDYDAGHDCGLPRRMILKTVFSAPHVPITMYENEVLFYRHVRPSLMIETPQVYAATFDG